jgi:hypothetical protein
MPAHGTGPNLITEITDLRRRLTVLENQQNGGVIDNNGVQRIAYGLLSSGDYGFAVTDAPGTTTTEFLPLYEANVLTTESTSSTSYTDLATPGPIVTAVIGMSGQALVTVNSYIGVPGGAGVQSAGFAGVSIDGTAPASPLDECLYLSVSAAAAVGIATNCSCQVVVTGLSPGSHTFEMKYKMAGPGAVNFDERFLQVRPLKGADHAWKLGSFVLCLLPKWARRG